MLWTSGKCWPIGDIAFSGCADILQTVQWSNRLELRKVKAHNPDGLAPGASAYLKWTTMGNEVADAAARQARSCELDLVVQLSDSIAESSRYQLDHLLSFSRFLIDLNVADIERKDQLEELPQAAEGPADIGSLVHSYFREWDEYILEDFLQPNLPTASEDRLKGHDVEIAYDRELLRWLGQLRWPAQPQADECPPDVTFLEIFVAFTLHSHLLPPLSIEVPEGDLYLDANSPEGQQWPDSPLATLERFRRRIRAIETALGRDLLLAGEIFGITRLGKMGIGFRLVGLDARPQLPEVKVWVPVVLEWARQFETLSILHDALGRRNNPPEAMDM